MEFSLIRLNEEMRSLIEQVAPNDTERVLLDPLDKGLSGANVWLAKWLMRGGIETPLTVIKIGQRHKIAREVDAYNNIVQELDNDVGAIKSHLPEAAQAELGILKQPFRGDAENFEVVSLLSLIRAGLDYNKAIELVDEIYLSRLKNWHPVNRVSRHVEEMELGQALDWWMSRLDLETNMNAICRPGISAELKKRFDLSASALEGKISELTADIGQFVIGPVHGDLHSQNILLEPETDRIHLIDFGWTARKWKAIDFLMLECSLKFLATPSNARVTDLLRMEEYLDGRYDWSISEEWDRRVFGQRLQVIGGMIERIRKLCIEHYQFASSMEQYRRGLVLLTAALAGYPALNRRFLINSLAYHTKALEK